MPSKDKATKPTNDEASEARPFTIFFVNPETPEEVHTDTIMAADCDDALAIAAVRHRTNTILHVRGIGESELSDDRSATGSNHFPCARFIKGKFYPTTFSDDGLLESLFD